MLKMKEWKENAPCQYNFKTAGMAILTSEKT